MLPHVTADLSANFEFALLLCGGDRETRDVFIHQSIRDLKQNTSSIRRHTGSEMTNV